MVRSPSPRRPPRPTVPDPVLRLGRLLGMPVTEVARYWSQERTALRRGFAALLLATVADLGAGVILGSAQGSLSDIPGLLILIPAAIAVRGSSFGALGARLGTAIMTGQFDGELNRNSYLGRQIEAIAILTLVTSTAAAVIAKILAGALGLATVPLWDLITISVVGGVLTSLALLAVTVGLARAAFSRGWSMDDVGAPTITATGDLLAIPALLLATLLISRGWLTMAIGVVLTVATVATLWVGWFHTRPELRRLIRESLVVLTLASTVSVLAGVVLGSRQASFLEEPALLVLFPAFLATLGSLGGMLSSRLTSKLHLGSLEPRTWPGKTAGLDFSVTYLFAVVISLFVGAATWAAATLIGLHPPALLSLMGVTLVGGILGTTCLAAVAYTAATATYRFGLDPDNHAIPIVTSAMDFLGTLCLVAAIALLRMG